MAKIRSMISALIIALMTTSMAFSADLMVAPQKHGLAITKQTKNVRINCFPERLKKILRQIQKTAGRRMIVTSGHRARRGKSYHTKCMAADFRIPGVSTSTVVKIARTIPGVGGIGTYRKKPGLIHVDIGPRRNWVH